MRGAILAIAIVAGAVGLAAFLHGLDIAADGPSASAKLHASTLVEEVKDWRYAEVDPASGAVLWEARGARAKPDADRNFQITEVRYTTFGKKPVTATAAFATASFPYKADAIIRFQRDIQIAQGTWLMSGDEMVLVLPPGADDRPDKRRAELRSGKPVTLEIAEVHGRFEGSGMTASADAHEALLAPPVHGELDAEALVHVGGLERGRAVRKGDRLFVDTDAPVKIVETDEDAYKIDFTGPARPRLVRGKESVPYNGWGGGGTIRLRKPRKEDEKAQPKEGAAAPPSALENAPESAELRDGVELRQGERLLAAGERLLWDGERQVATLLRGPAKQAELHAQDGRADVAADTIRYLFASSQAELEGAVRGSFPYEPKRSGAAEEKLGGTWRLEAPLATVVFERSEGDAAGGVESVHARAAGAELVTVRHEEDGGHGEADEARYFPRGGRLELAAAEGRPPARFTRGASTLAARAIAIDRAAGTARLDGDVAADLESELWGGRAAAKEDGGAESARLAAADWHVESDELTARFAPGGGTLTALELAGREREALLRSRPRAPAEPVYEVRGARISADRRAGTVAVLPAPGGAPRQTLVRGRDRLEAREIRYDEARGVAIATGEALYQRAADGTEPPLRAEAAEVELRFVERQRPSQVLARGAPGVPVVVVRGEMARERGQPADPAARRPVRLLAPRIDGSFDLATGKLAEVHVEGEGGPVVVEPAYAAPEAERFRLLGSRIVYDVASEKGEVFGLNGPPVVVRGADERLTAARLLFDLGALTVSLRGGIGGRFLAQLPASLAERGARKDRPTLFDLEADEADLSMTEGVAALEARGKVHFHDKQNDVRADKAIYRRESSTVTLEGRPVEILRGSRNEGAPRTLVVRLNPDVDGRE
jgi:lipopolysaccharide export system protein LptA